MSNIIRLPEFLWNETSEQWNPSFAHNEVMIPSRQLWFCFLAMAVRDEANCLRWQPWESEHVMTYNITATQFTLVSPDEQYASSFFNAAQRLISPGLWGWLKRQVSNSGSGILICESASGTSKWHGIWWRAGQMTGVDFVRLDQFPTPVIKYDLSETSSSFDHKIPE